MQNIDLYDNKTQHLQQKLYDIRHIFSKCPSFAATQAPGASLQGEDQDCDFVTL